MFTGIIEEMGKVTNINQTNESFTIEIEAIELTKDIDVGNSISVNGICLTVTFFQNPRVTVDVMPETVKATNLQQVSKGSFVNLERSIPANGRFGGHFVSGHVDGTGEIIEKTPERNAVYYRIRTSEDVTRYVVMKGSVAVDGISLTVFGVTGDTFTISLIPHTLDATILGSKNTGDKVNIECDMIGKYIEKLLANRI